ncbi:sodium:solute symporter family protein [Archaeoglobus profundus]|uniref:Na+/solute symporter n=1 Tax=Archaeoglobus profundus (strain DSM 5631 / JCM 9629 / NBRC 100127 / Av18) TaxID=572546 RepID=D2RFT4_ARCPA|nr:sodium:solute symporter family protein [Archaeoglobus profundus]ADB57159.1 Na+/solute symporter [Archaeoglobus profundus DSM 5631]
MMLLAVIIYMIIGTLISLYARRGITTQEDYFLANRRLGGIISALTYASTTYSAFMMVGLVGLAYATGVGSAGFELMYLVGTLFLLSYYSPKFWKLGREKGYVSPCEVFEDRYGKSVATLSAILALIALIPYTSIQIIGSAYLLQIDYTVATLIVAFVIAFWAFLGGMRSVAITDAIQGIFMISVAIIAVIWTAKNIAVGIPESASFPNEFWTPLRFASLTVPWFFFALTNPQVSQRMFVPKDEKALKNMVILFGAFGLIYTVLVTILGLFLRMGTEIGTFPYVSYRDKVTPTLLTMMPEPLAIAVALSIIMASVTTANSIVLTLSSMILRDVVGEREKVALGRMFVVALTLALIIFAIQKPGYIVELAVLSSTILLCQLPLILGVFHFKIGGKMTGLATLIAGFTTAIVLSLMKVSWTSIAVFVVSFAVFFLIGAIEKAKSS